MDALCSVMAWAWATFGRELAEVALSVLAKRQERRAEGQA